MVVWDNEITLKLLSITMDNIKKLFNCIVDSDLNAVSINQSNQIGSNNFSFSSTSYTKTNYNNDNDYCYNSKKTRNCQLIFTENCKISSFLI